MLLLVHGVDRLPDGLRWPHATWLLLLLCLALAHLLLHVRLLLLHLHLLLQCCCEGPIKQLRVVQADGHPSDTLLLLLLLQLLC
jgi:hypothetical protein